MILNKFTVISFFFKQKTAYEMRISDWSSDVCSSDLWAVPRALPCPLCGLRRRWWRCRLRHGFRHDRAGRGRRGFRFIVKDAGQGRWFLRHHAISLIGLRSEEHTSELQSLMRISYAVFCLKKKINNNHRLSQLQFEQQTL